MQHSHLQGITLWILTCEKMSNPIRCLNYSQLGLGIAYFSITLCFTLYCMFQSIDTSLLPTNWIIQYCFQDLMSYCLVHSIIKKDCNLNQGSHTCGLHVACSLILYGPLTDLIPIIECGLTQCHRIFFYLKCVSSWAWGQ